VFALIGLLCRPASFFSQRTAHCKPQASIQELLVVEHFLEVGLRHLALRLALPSKESDGKPITTRTGHEGGTQSQHRYDRVVGESQGSRGNGVTSNERFEEFYKRYVVVLSERFCCCVAGAALLDSFS
jgi:hypothetical protein